MAFVLDASVAAAWVLPDEDAGVADVALDRLGAETAKVPGLFWRELRNLLLSAERRGRIDGGYADTSMARINISAPSPAAASSTGTRLSEVGSRRSSNRPSFTIR